MKLAALFSGGKDSTYSIYKVKQMGHDVKCLVTVFPKSSDSQLLHFPAIELTKLQSKTLKISQITSTLDSNELAEEMDALKILLKGLSKIFKLKDWYMVAYLANFRKNVLKKSVRKMI